MKMWNQERFCKISFLSLTLLICIFVNDMVTSGNTHGYLRLRLEMRLKQEFIGNEITNCGSAISCFSACFSDSSCNIGSWGPDRRCQMSSSYAIYFGVGNETATKFLEPAGGWVATAKTVKMEIQVNPVVLYTRAIGFTFPEGEQLCQAEHVRIATPGELLDARGNGFERCKCGWLSDETEGFVMQSHHTSCWDTFTTGVHDCSRVNPTEGVYCKLP